MTYEIFKRDKILKGKINLPSSKSISNRVLIIQSLCSKNFQIKNISDSSDTQTLKKLLNKLQTTNRKLQTLNAEDGGTTFRFLTALLSITDGEWILTGSERMKKRPIGILVDNLRKIGADIKFLNKNGFPPLKIKGKKLEGKKLTINSSISSQYISALLIIAPILKNGLTIQLKGKIVSTPYILMTLKIMGHFGIKYSWKKNTIRISQQEYNPKDFSVESDWSASSYFYEMAAFADKVDLYLTGLKKNSLQGDSVIADLMKDLGVKTEFIGNGIRLIRENLKFKIQDFKFDFTDCPDLAQTMLVICAGLGITATTTGIENLKIKETNRILALKNELHKFGAKISYQKSTIQLSPPKKLQTPNSKLQTYSDHRMAMAFAPLAILTKKVSIENPEVVRKSYPDYWNNLKKTGFRIKKVK